MLGRSEFALRQGFRLRRKRLYAPSGAPHLRWGPEELGDRKSKAAQLGGFAKGNDTYFRLKKAFMPGYSATSPSLPLCAMAHNGDPVI